MNALREFANIELISHRCVIQFFQLKGLSPSNIKAELDSILGQSALKVCNSKILAGRVKMESCARKRKKFTKWYYMTVD